MLNLRYDSDSDSLYVYLTTEIAPGEARWQVPFDYLAPELAGFIADLSESGQLLGIEILDARERIAWRDLHPNLGPALSDSYDSSMDVSLVSFGGQAVGRIEVTDQMFDRFAVDVGLDRAGRVTELAIPQASRQLDAEWLKRK